MSKLSTLRELMRFLGQNKKLWLVPIIMVLMFLGVVLVIAEGSVIAPFIYTLF